MKKIVLSFGLVGFLLALIQISAVGCRGEITLPLTTAVFSSSTACESSGSSSPVPSTGDILTTTGLPLIAAQPPANAVWLINIGVNPEVLTVRIGATVTWTDFDELPYTVVSDGGLFLSPELALGSSWSFTFTQPGSYSYHVSEDMTGLVGEIIVQ